jgi:hypothetical protein
MGRTRRRVFEKDVRELEELLAVSTTLRFFLAVLQPLSQDLFREQTLVTTEGAQQLVRIALGDTSRLRLDQLLVPIDQVVQPRNVAVSLFHLSLENRDSVAQRRVVGAQLSVQPAIRLSLPPSIRSSCEAASLKRAVNQPQLGRGALHIEHGPPDTFR